MKKLLIVYYSYTGGTAQMVEAAADAAREEEGSEICVMRAEDCQPEDMLSADGYIFATPENLAAIAGVMKAFFDRCYYPLLGKIEGRPYAAMICAGSDGENARKQVERIATGWRLKKVIDSQIICTHAQTEEEILAQKTIGPTDLAKCSEIGATLSAGLAMGVF
ncbi:NAD(P)H-dependent oxidoreductase [uncultured Parasphingorhabdus sp.]|uniref:flavodoxin family protein n=1 Tax=uncultured Parasphingorhabdus sp. TaxID=2709694 RepID=UPI0030D9FE4E